MSSFNGSARFVGVVLHTLINGSAEIGDGITETRVQSALKVNGFLKAHHVHFEAPCEMNGNAEVTDCRFFDRAAFNGNVTATQSTFTAVFCLGSNQRFERCSVQELEVRTPSAMESWGKAPRLCLSQSTVKVVRFVNTTRGEVHVDDTSTVGEVVNGTMVRVSK